MRVLPESSALAALRMKNAQNQNARNSMLGRIEEDDNNASEEEYDNDEVEEDEEEKMDDLAQNTQSSSTLFNGYRSLHSNESLGSSLDTSQLSQLEELVDQLIQFHVPQGSNLRLVLGLTADFEDDSNALLDIFKNQIDTANAEVPATSANVDSQGQSIHSAVSSVMDKFRKSAHSIRVNTSMLKSRMPLRS